MTRMIRRTIVVEYRTEYSYELERDSPALTHVCGEWHADLPCDAEIRETVEEITEDAGKPPDGVSGRVDQ